MERRQLLHSDKKLITYLKAGYAEKHGKNYQPWAKVQNQTSIGKTSRIFGWKSQRMHHLFSDNETRYFYLMEWDDSVIDIREKYPLLNIELAIKIANEKGLKYPYNNRTGNPRVLYSDFIITKINDGKTIDKAISVLPFEKLEENSVINKLRIESKYWKGAGIQWNLIIDKDIPKTLSSNIEFLHSYHSLEDLCVTDSIKFENLISILIKRIPKEKGPIRSVLNMLDIEFSEKPGKFLQVFLHLLSTKRISMNLNISINLDNGIENLIVNDKIQVEKEMLA